MFSVVFCHFSYICVSKRVSNTNIMSKSASTRIRYFKPMKKDKTYPVKLVVTYKRERRSYSTGISLTKSDYAKVMGKAPRGKYKEYWDDLEGQKHDADEIIRGMKKFSFSAFKKAFTNPVNPDEDVYSLYNYIIADLKAEGRIGNANAYLYSMKSIKSFSARESLPFDNIDVQFLNKYEAYMLSKENPASLTTISIYLTHLKAVLNLAKEKGYLDELPFGRSKDKYQIKGGVARNIALEVEELRAIFTYSAKEGSVKQKYVDLWKFSYLCGGMNVKDICMLRKENIVRNKIMYKREKTKRSNFKGKEVSIIIDEHIQTILNRWGNMDTTKTPYIFPFLEVGMSPQRIKAVVSQVVKQINKYINKVADELEIDVRITTYTARHSYANHLSNLNVSDSDISKQLGHSSVKTTMTYLGSFRDRKLEEIQNRATNFDEVPDSQ